MHLPSPSLPISFSFPSTSYSRFLLSLSPLSASLRSSSSRHSPTPILSRHPFGSVSFLLFGTGPFWLSAPPSAWFDQTGSKGGPSFGHVWPDGGPSFGLLCSIWPIRPNRGPLFGQTVLFGQTMPEKKWKETESGGVGKGDEMGDRGRTVLEREGNGRGRTGKERRRKRKGGGRCQEGRRGGDGGWMVLKKRRRNAEKGGGDGGDAEEKGEKETEPRV